HLPNKLLKEETRIKKAIQLARSFWDAAHAEGQHKWFEETASEVEREWCVRTQDFKKLIQPADEKDDSTAQGYLKMEHDLTYKTVGKLREQLIRAGIPLSVPEGYSMPLVCELQPDGELQPAREYVLARELDKFAETIRAKERERKRSIRAKKKGRQENPPRDTQKKTQGQHR